MNLVIICDKNSLYSTVYLSKLDNFNGFFVFFLFALFQVEDIQKKKRAFRKFTYRGVDLDQLLDMPKYV